MIAGTSCKKYLDINEDPFLPQTAPPNTYLPQILYSMAEGIMFDSRYLGCYTQNWNLNSANYNWDRHGSRLGTPSANQCTQTFRNHYWAIGSNVNQMVEQAADRGFGGYEGIGNTIKAWSWEVVTDGYGELPYSQAWDNTRTKFDYDDQRDIYAGVMQLADEAIAQLDAGGGTVDPKLASWDLMYNGDLSKWKKFVYAIKARMEIHKSNKPSFSADKVIEYVNKSFTSNAEHAAVKFEGSSGNTSSFFGISRGNYTSYRPGKAIIDLLNGNIYTGVIDPRLSLMFNAHSDGNYYGIAPGVGDTMAIKAPRMYGKYLFKDDADFPLISYPEILFIKAEAAFKKNDKPLAYTTFIDAIKAHMSFTGVSTADANTYLASTAVPQSSAALTLRDILCQKYIAMFMNNETWSDLRRNNYDLTLYPSYIIPSNLKPENNGKLAERQVYIQFSEFDWNLEAVIKQGADQPDYHTKKIWVFTNQE